jgi:hypothetical protein
MLFLSFFIFAIILYSKLYVSGWFDLFLDGGFKGLYGK